MTTFTGVEEVRVFQAISIKQGLKLLKVGMRPGRGWTLTKTLAAAGEITGKKYKRSELIEAVADLETWIEEQRGG